MSSTRSMYGYPCSMDGWMDGWMDGEERGGFWFRNGLVLHAFTIKLVSTLGTNNTTRFCGWIRQTDGRTDRGARIFRYARLNERCSAAWRLGVDEGWTGMIMKHIERIDVEFPRISYARYRIVLVDGWSGGEREKSYWSLGRLNNLLFSIRRYYIIMWLIEWQKRWRRFEKLINQVFVHLLCQTLFWKNVWKN